MHFTLNRIDLRVLRCDDLCKREQALLTLLDELVPHCKVLEGQNVLVDMDELESAKVLTAVIPQQSGIFPEGKRSLLLLKYRYGFVEDQQSRCHQIERVVLARQ